jgi:chitin synthase
MRTDAPLPQDLGPFVANMYLAEDRILCFEIVAKRRRQWILKCVQAAASPSSRVYSSELICPFKTYLPLPSRSGPAPYPLRYIVGAGAETDAPSTLIELIKQRRRWLNGSFFSLLYYLYHFPRFMHTAHGLPRKFGFIVQFLFQLTTMLFSWFTLASLLLSFYLIFNQSIDFAVFGQRETKLIFLFVYTVLIFGQVVVGLAAKVRRRVALEAESWGAGGKWFRVCA